MADDIEGAENVTAPVPPTESTPPTELQATAKQIQGTKFSDLVTEEFGWKGLVDGSNGTNATDDANTSHVVTEKAEDTAQTENADVDATDAEETPEQKAEREKFIPRDRFDQVHTKATTLEQELAKVNAEREQERLAAAQREEQFALRAKALDAGYSTVEAYSQANAWAVTQGADSIEQYNELVALRDSLVADQPDISDKVLNTIILDRQERLRDKAERAKERAELQETRGLLNSVRTERQQIEMDRSLDTAASTLKEAGVADAAITAFVTKAKSVGVSPQYIADTVDLLKMTATEAGKNAVIAANERKAANGNGTPPEGRGGGQPPVQVPKMSPQEAKNTSLSELLGFRKNYG